MVPKRGLEPLRPFEHNDLNVACMPISPLRRLAQRTITVFIVHDDWAFVKGDLRDDYAARLQSCQDADESHEDLVGSAQRD